MARGDEAMEPLPNDRKGVRTRIEFEVLYSAARREGSGTLKDLSPTGALVEDASFQPDVGEPVRAHLFPYADTRPVALIGEVTRHTKRGFAIVFADVPAEARELIADAQALVTVPPDAPETS